MPQFEFTLTLSGLDGTEPNFEDRLFEAGCDDALISMVKGAVVLDFTREAKNFVHAVASAVGDIGKSGAKVVRIEPDTYVTISDIAVRAGLSKQAISLFAQGKRGPGDFPPPALRINTESPLWDWLKVSRWLFHNRKLEDRKTVVYAALTREFNAILERQKKPLPRKRRLERVFVNYR
jgi:hypothetical protein